MSNPNQDLARKHGVDAAFFLVNVTTKDLAEIVKLIDDGALRTHVGAVLPLSGAIQAHLMLEGLRPRPKGKIVLSDVVASLI